MNIIENNWNFMFKCILYCINIDWDFSLFLNSLEILVHYKLYNSEKFIFSFYNNRVIYFRYIYKSFKFRWSWLIGVQPRGQMVQHKGKYVSLNWYCLENLLWENQVWSWGLWKDSSMNIKKAPLEVQISIFL